MKKMPVYILTDICGISLTHREKRITNLQSLTLAPHASAGVSNYELPLTKYKE